MLRRKTNEVWKEEHRHVTRKLVVEGSWVQKRLYDIGWSDEKKCRGCNQEEGTEKHRFDHCPCCVGRSSETRGTWEMGAKGQNAGWGNGSRRPRHQRKVGKW